jgi:hypothetical protein
MTTTTLSDIEAFFTRYQENQRTTEDQALCTFQSRFESFKVGYQEVKSKTLAENRQLAPAFNIFRVLSVAHNEERTHSAFLAHLLNPNQSHDQQTLFLEAFLSHCQAKFANFPLQRRPEEIAHAYWLTATEFHTTSGNLDIVLRSPGFGFICVIENKIYASEQKEQIHRYAQWLETQRKNYPYQILFYLTRTGGESYTAQSAAYEKLSYHNDIHTILSGVLDRIDAAKVKETVRQYMELIIRL